jgi:hypothetical protein
MERPLTAADMPINRGGARRAAGEDALEVAVPGNAAEDEHEGDVPPREIGRDCGGFDGLVGGKGRGEAASGAEDVGQGDEEAEYDETDLEHIGVSDRPDSANHGVEGDDERGEQDR